MKLGYIGLGKMGGAMAERLLKRGHGVVAYDAKKEARDRAVEVAAQVADSPVALVKSLNTPRIIWLMLPHAVVDETINGIREHLSEGDTIIDGGNSHYKESIRRAEDLKKEGINFLDVGVSGGPGGAKEGACLMIGGEKAVYEKLEPLFKDLAAPDGYGYIGNSGAGHFVKMVHNGIEYGMMQAIAEGFTILSKSDFHIDLKKTADLYNHASVIESRLIGWAKSAFEQYGENLDEISGSVSHTGEGAWTVEAAKELGVPVPIIEGALRFRVDSEKNPSFIGKILSALRNQFGGHDVKMP